MRVLVTGAGSGFGKAIVLRLAQEGLDVIAGVEISAQIQGLKDEAKGQNLKLRVEKLDVTNAADRRRAEGWDIDVLLNNAGMEELGRRSVEAVV